MWGCSRAGSWCCAEEQGDDEDGDALRAPLILHIADEDEGSVGSDDTTDCALSELGEAAAPGAPPSPCL